MEIISNNIHNRRKKLTSLSVVESPVVGRLIVSHRGKSHLLKFQNILFCRAEGNYTTIQLCDGRCILVSKCLKEIISKLPSSYFERIHQSYLVNLDLIGAVGRDEIYLENYSCALPLSRTYKKTLRLRLGC